MNKLVRTTLNLEQYQCGRCGRFFYINEKDKSDLDFKGYGCPYGCDDKGELTRKLYTEVKKVKGIAKGANTILAF